MGILMVRRFMQHVTQPVYIVLVSSASFFWRQQKLLIGKRWNAGMQKGSELDEVDAEDDLVAQGE